MSSPRLLVPYGQPPASHVSSSTYQAHPAGPGLPREEPSAAAVIVMYSSYRHPACLITRGTRPGSFGQWDEAGAASASCSKIGGGRGRALRRNDEDGDYHEHSQR